MPRKTKKNPEAESEELGGAEGTPFTGLEITPIDSGNSQTEDRPKKRARKKSASPPALEAAVEAVAAPEYPVPQAGATPADAEVAAQTIETFEDAFEANDASEAKRPRPARSSHEADEEDSDDEPHAYPSSPERLERLQKILAQAGIASRRHAEELITEGRVQVNGKIVTELGTKADPTRDHIRVDGKLLHGAERLRYFVLNKPKGFVTTVSDPEGRPTVMEFFARMNERLYPVGRLDYLSEGLLLVTNDGDLANKLTRAASGVEKTYLVKVSGQPTEDEIETLQEGVNIERGKPGEGRVRTAPARIRQVRQGDNPWFEVVLIEGRNRELRKMFEEIGHHVEKIRRVGYGPLVLDQEPGKMRELDAEELRLLQLAAEGKWKPKRVKTSDMLPKEAGRSVDVEGKRRGGKPAGPGSGGRPGQRTGGAGQRPFQSRGGERPRYQDRGPGGNRGVARGDERGQPRREGGFGARGGTGAARPQAGGERPFRGRPAGAGDRPSFERPGFGDRPRRPFGEQGSEERRAFRPRGERPAGGRPGTKPPGRGFGQGAQRGFGQGSEQRGQGNRRSFGQDSEVRGQGERRSFGEGTGGQRRGGSRPPRREGTAPPRSGFGGRPEGRGQGQRPAFGEGAGERRQGTGRPLRREGFAPSREGSAPRREGFAPRRDASAPRREGSAAPRREGTAPPREGTRRSFGTRPQGEGGQRSGGGNKGFSGGRSGQRSRPGGAGRSGGSGRAGGGFRGRPSGGGKRPGGNSGGRRP